MAAVAILDDAPRDRLALLLKHFSEIEDTRESWRVMYPLSEVLLAVVCGTPAACDDFDDIAAWGGITWISCAGSRPSTMAFSLVKTFPRGAARRGAG